MRAEVGIVIKQDYRNKGYALATITRIKAYAANILHLHQLYACINKDNERSLALFEKSGFIKSNELKDWLFDGKKYHNALLMQLFCKKSPKSLVDKKNIHTFATAIETDT